MASSGAVAVIRVEEGNLGYERFAPLDDPETVLPVDAWRNQRALDVHHASPMMGTIAELRGKYDLPMSAQRFVAVDPPAGDAGFARE
ncbi:antibiotic biosynthesis monooxygenase family protein [Olsenella profusa]|uniref:Antibiotic biosynthesis monooxygenase n=1 Tax=Olsenella profusa F0195 TaxID=1125712 RepID=U2TUR3_9ACTN|nr:antibiotic biosynthesis monooxygenase [Olsenella profusa]ERL09803.1 antibiotic biosynthesis monooxygenase [Olsenella profusa F0195]